MNDRWARVESIFNKVVDADRSQRSALLKESCAGDESLRREVESLLAHHRNAGDFIESPAFEDPARSPLPSNVLDDAGRSRRTTLAQPSLKGSLVAHYRVLEEIGVGGMGIVYKAEDVKLGRPVALKFLPEQMAVDSVAAERFRREARAASALNHPNICTIYEIGQHDGREFIAMEFLAGQTLAAYISGRAHSSDTVAKLGIPIAEALTAAHSKGVIHRDIKPGNIFVTSSGLVKVLDFGVAKLLQVTDSASTFDVLTETNAITGTLPYMSPEQLRGDDLDARSDIYALGVVLYEIATGQRPYTSSLHAKLIDEILHRPATPPSTANRKLPPKLDEIILKCLEKDPENRYQSAKEIAVDLRRMSAPASGQVVAGNLGEPASRPGIAIAGAILAVLLGVGALAYFWSRPAAVPRISNYVQLTHDGQPKSLVGREGSRLFVYVASGDNQGMNEMSTAGGEPRKMQVPPLSFNSPQPLSLSQDGSELLVMDGHGMPPSGPLWSVPVIGGSPRKLGDIAAQDGSWSADGKFIAYSNGNSLFTAKSDGTDARKVITVGDAGFVFCPVWSPDGNHLRFMYGATLAAPEYFMEISLDGTGLHRLMPGWTNLPDLEFRNGANGAWTLDGKYFLFTARGQIWVLPRRAGFLHSEPKPSQLTSSPMPLSPPVQSTDGKKLFVVGRAFRGELTRYDLKSRRFESYLGGISAEYVSFSKDGQWVAYVSFPEGTLWRSKIDGSERLQLTYAPSQALMPRWSPDGKTILFFDAGTNKPSKIYEVSREGGSPRPLMPDNPDPQIDPNWSPDGSKIVFAGRSADATSSIRVFDLATRQVSTLPGSQGLYSPRWSRDGRYIPALSADSKRLLLFDFQTQQWTELAQGSMGWLEWSKDGRSLQANDSSGAGGIIRIRLSDHKTERIVDLKNFFTVGFYGSWFAVAPDDSPIMLRNAGTQDVYALDWEEP